ncbi:ABC transporter, ATP-binding protein [Teladorsagia circumcincta]|uniref:ABC transporter, ATP-binding protein n=1 Tax=Teladorsagia circumcincta TaxID=45464 RepID=A0A2G9UGY9_TELCI|nr:ABC transporter, ATP-binding protein [Teladorsagia circumcincta]
MQKSDETASLLTSDTQSVTSYGGTSNAPSADDTLDAVDPITLSWRDLRVSVAGKGRELLQGVSGIARPGELLALMGASGAGKTTLLNTFLHRNLKGLHVEGRVEINGNKARLRTNLSQERREKRVNVILAQLGLTKCQNNRIGVAGVRKGISGGEARRLTFACELLSNPGILFCDEPTTGLDSFMAEHVVVVLSKLASSGRNYGMALHANLDKVTSTTVPPGRRRVNFGIQIAALLHRYEVLTNDALEARFIFFYRYGFEALAINQWNEVNDANSTGWNNQRRDEVLAQYSFNADRFILDQLLMVAFIFVFYLIGYVGLSIRIYRSR